MRTKICGQKIQRIVIFIGLFYLLQAILGSTGLIINLIKYNEDKAKSSAEGVPYDEDRDVVSLLSVSLSFSLTFVLTSPFLIWGAFKEIPSWLIPWLYNSFACILVICIYLFVTTLKNIYEFDKANFDLGQIALITIIMSVGLALQIIFYKIVYKYYKVLLTERQLQYLENSSTIFIVNDEPFIRV